jgi:hypothetical protein
MIEAMSADAEIIATERRIVKRQAAELAMPTIESPAKTGQTYRTSATEFVLRGNAPEGATGIMVNDYVLKLFTPGKGTWSYVANENVGNLKRGTNVYEVRAFFGDVTRKSDAAKVTILLEEGTEGVVAGGTTSSTSTVVNDPTNLPNNTPLTPGVIKVTAPVEGTEAVMSGTGFVLEGNTSTATDSMWVNDYRLQLFKSGGGYWNYLADPNLNTLKPGKNTYKLVARNKEGEILDTLEYVVTYEP